MNSRQIRTRVLALAITGFLNYLAIATEERHPLSRALAAGILSYLAGAILIQIFRGRLFVTEKTRVSKIGAILVGLSSPIVYRLVLGKSWELPLISGILGVFLGVAWAASGPAGGHPRRPGPSGDPEGPHS